MKKYFLALVAALVLCVPAFAESSQFGDEPFSVTFSNNDTYSFSASDPAQPIYYYLIYNDINQVTLRAISQYYNALCIQSLNGVPSSNTINLDYQTGDCYTHSLLIFGSPLPAMSQDLSIWPYSTSGSDLSAALSSWINSNSPTPAFASSFTVPCGNVLYFQVSSEQDVTLSAQMPQLSYLVQFGNNAYGPWGDTGIEYGPAASLPTSGTTFPILSMDPVQWAKGEPKNILGQSKVGVASKHCIVGQWYALFCPLTSPQVLDASTGDHAMGASVVVSGSFSQIKVYPLSETLDYDNPLGATYESGSNDGYDSYFDGSSDENGTVTWTNQDGQVQAPQSGGTNYVSPAANAESLLSQIRQLLANIVSELKSLFTFGYEAVQDLVGIMRDFVNVLGGLYTWLPAEVYSALMSAVVVAIVIGVFKVFL